MRIRISFCVIWAYDVHVAFHNWLDSLWLICLFDNHLSKYGNLFMAAEVLHLWCSLLICVCKAWMAPLYVVVERLAR